MSGIRFGERTEMTTDRSDPVQALSKQLSGLYVGMEDFAEEGTMESLLRVVALLRDLRMAIGTFDSFAVAMLRKHNVLWSEIAASLGETTEDVLRKFQLVDGEGRVAEQPRTALSNDPSNVLLVEGNIYTRSELREIFNIRDAAINNGVFHFRLRNELRLFITENKQADREQYVDKLVGNTLYWQASAWAGPIRSSSTTNGLGRVPLFSIAERSTNSRVPGLGTKALLSMLAMLVTPPQASYFGVQSAES